MRRITLLRHGKSSYPGGLSDYERPLTERGQEDAGIMGHLCAQRIGVPDRVYVSSARRTLETIELFFQASGGSSPAIHVMDELYLADAHQWIQILQDDVKSGHVLLCGHQPGLGILAELWDSQAIGDLPTCGMVSFLEKPEGMVMDIWERPKHHRGS
ncbi:MAG: histidine phosphatase family protein [Spirochaetales bacterium]|nr:histidine phosphatase family protein [Spirochaetales bacterium]